MIYVKVMKFAPLILSLCTCVIVTGCSVPDIAKTCNCSATDYPYPQRDGLLACPIEPQQSESTYRNLVFKGGGVKAIAYGGAMDVLTQRGDMANIKRVAGTSAGAITAALLAVGFDGCAVANFTAEFDFENLKDGSLIYDATHAIESFGWFRGDYFQCAMECAIDKRPGLNKRSTFGELYDLAEKDDTYKQLYIVATNVNRESSVTFSHEKHADLAIADAVRMSMSIPFFFEAREYNGDVYVDGGVLKDYPLDTFDRSPFCTGVDAAGRCINEQTLGLYVRDVREDRNEVKSVEQFVGGLMQSLMDQQIDRFCAKPADVRRTVFIDTGSISATQFKLNKTQKMELINAGSNDTKDYFERKPSSCPANLFPPRAEQAVPTGGSS